MEINIILEPQEEGGYTVYVPSLPGCVSQGETKEEAIKNIKEAVELHIEVMGLPEEISSGDTIVINFEVNNIDKTAKVIR